MEPRQSHSRHQSSSSPLNDPLPPSGVLPPDELVTEHFNYEYRRATVSILGARGAGKTSIVRQFTQNEFLEVSREKLTPTAHHVTFIIEERIYEVKLVDCPSVVQFPVNSMIEWNEQRGCCLRTASAYILVYDVTDDEGFRYVQSMREQIVRCRDVQNVPMVVVANKQDLVASSTAGISAPNYYHLLAPHSATESLFLAVKNREVQANIVKKHWKCSFVECSVKHNWHVETVFRETVRAIDNVHYEQRVTNRVQEALTFQLCVIL